MGDPPREGAQLAAHEGEFGAQLVVDLVELRGRCGVDRVKVEPLRRLERHGGGRTHGRMGGRGHQRLKGARRLRD
eukprot:1140508-Alexandrium_andersonii.AAC.1